MKTAMKEMLLNIEALEAITTDQEQIYMLTHLKVGALLLLQKEKEQTKEISDEDIKQAAKDYDRINTIWGANVVFIDAVKWYKEQILNQTYNQDSELPKEDKTFKRKSQWTEVDNMTKRLK